MNFRNSTSFISFIKTRAPDERIEVRGEETDAKLLKLVPNKEILIDNQEASKRIRKRKDESVSQLKNNILDRLQGLDQR